MKENKITGVYKITNIITGDFYIGSSKNIEKRWAAHKSPSRWKRNPNVKLYKAFINYGLDNFTFEILEETDNLREREQHYIERLKPTYNDRHANGYNIERRKESFRRHNKEWHKSHQNEMLTYSKAYYQANRDECLDKMKANYSRLCFYEGETLTLKALSSRFFRQGIPHARLEAKKYLL